MIRIPGTLPDRTSLQTTDRSSTARWNYTVTVTFTLVELAADPGFLLPQHPSPTPHHETSVALSQRMRETLERLAKAEDQAFAGEFLAPAIPGGVVQIRIAGVVCRLKIEPDDFEGWGVFRTKSPTTAELVRPAQPCRAAAVPRAASLAPACRLPARGKPMVGPAGSSSRYQVSDRRLGSRPIDRGSPAF